MRRASAGARARRALGAGALVAGGWAPAARGAHGPAMPRQRKTRRRSSAPRARRLREAHAQGWCGCPRGCSGQEASSTTSRGLPTSSPRRRTCRWAAFTSTSSPGRTRRAPSRPQTSRATRPSGNARSGASAFAPSSSGSGPARARTIRDTNTARPTTRACAGLASSRTRRRFARAVSDPDAEAGLARATCTEAPPSGPTRGGVGAPPVIWAFRREETT